MRLFRINIDTTLFMNSLNSFDYRYFCLLLFFSSKKNLHQSFLLVNLTHTHCYASTHSLMLIRCFFTLHRCVCVNFVVYFLPTKKSQNRLHFVFSKMMNEKHFACGVTSITRDGERIYSIQNKIERKFLFCH